MWDWNGWVVDQTENCRRNRPDGPGISLVSVTIHIIVGLYLEFVMDIRSSCVIDKRYTTAEEIVQMARESLTLAKEERKTQFFIHYFVRIPLLIIVIASSVRCHIIELDKKVTL